MKNSINKIASFLIALGVLGTSCTELEREDYQRIEADNFFKTEADMRAAVTAVYDDGIIGWWATGASNIGALSDLISDHTEFAWTSGWGYVASHYEYTPDNCFYMNDRYNLLVQGISKATSLLPKLETVPMDEDLKNRYIAEIRTLRANMVFWGYDVYNGVSIMTDPEELEDVSGKAYYKPRATSEESVDFIVSEIDAIKDDLPNKYNMGDADYGRMTKGAALTIKLKALMQEHRYVEAEETAREITTLGYSLVPKYSDVFALANEQHNETILSYPTKANLDPGNQYQAHWLAYDYPSSNPNSQKWGVYKLKWHVIDSFDPDDDRLNSIVTQYKSTAGVDVARGEGSLKYGGLVIKYDEDPSATGPKHGNDMIMFRYADVLLLLAEAINENNNGPTQEAIDLVNQVRERAFPGMPDKLLQLADYAGNKDAFNEHLLNERTWELYAEFVRRQDLIRHGKFHETARAVNPAYNEAQMYFPIPIWIVDQSEGVILQNPNY